jgi:predicted dehydrogenase
MAIRIAFVGFRHGHINGLYAAAGRREDLEIVAACEEHAPTREQLAEGPIRITHDSYETMLDEVECDVLACGDYFVARGGRLLEAMRRGKHVIADKPLCTSLDELAEIRSLAAEKGLRVGCMLDLRGTGPFRTLRRLIGEDRIGEVHTVTFTGQHALNYGKRSPWYFEDDSAGHGGTINDIAIHAIDAIPWMTGRKLVEVVSARCWSAKQRRTLPKFQSGAQLMLRLDNDGGVLGDVSYLAPDGVQEVMPQYWRTTCHGERGVLETFFTAETVFLASEGGASEHVPVDAADATSYLDDFLAELAGKAPAPGAATTESNLRSAEHALKIQRASVSGDTHVPLES